MYWPKSKIVTNLNANPNDGFLYVSNNKPYSGPYYKTYNGKYFTGNIPGESGDLEIYKKSISNGTSDTIEELPVATIDNNLNSLEFNKINNIASNTEKKLPYTVKNEPSESDYSAGFFKRYFLKKANESTYIEVDQDMWNNFNGKNSEWLYEMYVAFTITWKISNLREENYIYNYNTVNKLARDKNLFGLDFYFNGNFSKFTQ